MHLLVIRLDLHICSRDVGGLEQHCQGKVSGIYTLFLVLLTQRVISMPNYPTRRLPRSVYTSAELIVRSPANSRLILTPFIDSGNISEARNLSRVSGVPFNEDVPSYSGYFTVNETYNSNLFFWFFPAEVSTIIFLFYLKTDWLTNYLSWEHFAIDMVKEG